MNERFVELKQNFLPRFWDTGNKCMIYPEYDEKLGIYYCCKDNILPHNHPFDYSLLDISAILFNNRFKKMNPTGLKDKDGMLMYENDKVVHSNKFILSNSKPEEKVGFIKFDKKLARFVITGEYLNSNMNAEHCVYQIIGNIHTDKGE